MLVAAELLKLEVALECILKEFSLFQMILPDMAVYLESASSELSNKVDFGSSLPMELPRVMLFPMLSRISIISEPMKTFLE